MAQAQVNADSYNPGDAYALQVDYKLADGRRETVYRDMIVWDYDRTTRRLVGQWASVHGDDGHKPYGPAFAHTLDDAHFAWVDGSARVLIQARVGAYTAYDESANSIEIMRAAALRDVEQYQSGPRRTVADIARERTEATTAVERTTEALKAAVREAVVAGEAKIEVARAAGISRPTLDAWIAESS